MRNADVQEVMIYVLQRQLSAYSSLTFENCLWSYLFLITSVVKKIGSYAVSVLTALQIA
jgi:hypothetical protein